MTKDTKHQFNYFDKRHPLEIVFISLPAFVVGGYFSNILIATFIEYIPDASLSDWFRALPGILLVLLICLAALVAGFYGAARINIVVNTKLSVIGRRRELLGFHSKGKVISLNNVVKIICRQKTVKSQSKPGEINSDITYYHVDLLTKPDEQLPLIKFKQKSEAKKLGKSLADFSNLPLNDRL